MVLVETVLIQEGPVIFNATLQIKMHQSFLRELELSDCIAYI